MFASVQRRLDARGMGQSLVLNGMDNLETAQQFVATGTDDTYPLISPCSCPHSRGYGN